MKRLLLSVLTACAAAAFAAPTHAVEIMSDHLKCYKFKTSKDRWSIDPHAFDSLILTTSVLTDGESDCFVVPKKAPRPTEICIPATKVPNELPGPPLSSTTVYACYKMKCPKQEDVEGFSLSNQFGFGSGTIKAKPAFRRLCVPTIIALP